MKNILFIICLFIAGSLFAQTVSEDDIVGVYKPKSYNPMGGSTVVFMKDNTVVLSYFGGIQKGKWEVRDEEVLITWSAEPQFALYGRKLNILDTKTQINFVMDAENGILVGLDSHKKATLKPVFNENANCFSAPYTFTQDTELIQLHAAQSNYDEVDSDSKNKAFAKVYHFNNFNSYNDLILINLPSEYTTSGITYAIYKDGALYMDEGDEGIKKKPLETLNQEDLAFIKSFSNTSIYPKQILNGDEFFPNIERPTQDELKPYNRIAVLEISTEAITIQEGNFFTATCDED